MKNKKLSLLASNLISVAAATALSVLATQGALAQKKYDTGASDTEIKIGNVEAYSGPASAYGIIGKTEDAYFRMINDQGGVNGRKINFISYDDGYSPPKTVEQVRKLIESDEVFLVFNALGTPTQTAVQKYQNGKKVRSCSSPPAPASGTIRRIFHGPWAISRATASKPGFSRSTS